MSKSLSIVLFACFLLGGCATTRTTSKPTATPVVKAGTKERKACLGYPVACFCQPVGEHTGLLVGGDGRASLGPVMCQPDKKDLARRDSFCLPVDGADKTRGVQVTNGRVQLQKPGHTHNVRRSGPVWCTVKPRS
jgi:hypothetical protein